METIMTREEFAKEVEWFCSYYERPNLNETMFKLWFYLSEKYTKAEFSKALARHIEYDEFPNFPAYGKIYQQLIKIRRPIQ